MHQIQFRLAIRARPPWESSQCFSANCWQQREKKEESVKGKMNEAE